ncbi:MAG TPA: D-glycero-beta-D-manno-heptose-7-phosphate kinase [Alphaproteobacteria bacterium]|jgi:D-beta-D-heptose 7-phosphate kinase/D-beta-D-heptose 1-phosphate adenosyltransferase
MADRARLADALDRLAGARVAVVGDIMLDRYVYGEAERLSPEAPVPVLRVVEEVEMLGGAGNVLRNLAALGAKAACVAAVGEDADGERIGALIAKETGAAAHLAVLRGRPTSRKTRFVAGGHQLLRVDRERAESLGGAEEEAMIARVAPALEGAGAVILSDYGKGALSARVIAGVVAAAAKAKIPVLADPKGRDYSRYRGALLVTPNRKELGEASGMPTASDADMEAAARAIGDRAGVSAVLATRGPQGMTLLDEQGAVHHIAAEAREVFDVSGAGDTVIATVAAGLAAGLALLDAVRIANCAAGIVVGKAGTAVAYPGEIRAALERQERSAAEGKVASRAAAMERAALWRRRGLRVGFTNGCFDLLHPGHLHLLAQARAACDRLVVGLNSDASVKRLKGNGRPVQSEAARAAVLAGLADVDLVTVFGEDTPEALIAALRPDVLVKGADYTMQTVVGADLVKSYGGRVVLAELLPGHSTSATVAKIK